MTSRTLLLRALLPLLPLAGCASPLASLTRTTAVSTVAGAVEVHGRPEDDTERARVEQALARAAPRLSRWGELRTPVKLYVMPSHVALERAVGRRGYDWLRAWAKYDEVFLQTPGSWVAPGDHEADLDELLTHELTHCVMYQHGATAADWADKQIPLWFREGMATWTAEQGYRFVSLEQLARFMDSHPDADPVLQAELMYQRQSEFVYSAAHLAFGFLARRYSEDQVKRLLAVMASGATFPTAFHQAIGISEQAFVAEFRRYVRWRGFRGNGRSLH